MQLLVGELVAGLYFPIATTILGSIHILGRIAFQIGYSKSPNARRVGAIISLLMSIILPILGFVASILLF